MRSLRLTLKDYSQLGKLRLSLLVVYSAVFGYLIGAEETEYFTLFILALGGLLITMGANAFNEIIEKDFDAMMTRTASRPLPSGRMRSGQAVIFASFTTLLGVHLLTAFISPVVGVLGLLSVVSYVIIYTPMKRVGSLSVWVGTIPGALPLLIGWHAATGEFSLGGWILFLIQVFWQLSHFWTIAWLAYEDYQKAGFQMLPLKGGKTFGNAYIIAFSVLPLLMIPYISYKFHFISLFGAISLLLLTAPMVFFAYKIITEKNDGSVKKLMFASFAYLPLAFIFIYLDKIL